MLEIIVTLLTTLFFCLLITFMFWRRAEGKVKKLLADTKKAEEAIVRFKGR